MPFMLHHLYIALMLSFRIFARFATISTACATSSVFGFAETPRHVLVLHHMFNLPLHCDKEENYKVEEEYWPENRDVKNTEECHEE